LTGKHSIHPAITSKSRVSVNAISEALNKGNVEYKNEVMSV
jgi:hypothetical protein